MFARCCPICYSFWSLEAPRPGSAYLERPADLQRTCQALSSSDKGLCLPLHEVNASVMHKAHHARSKLYVCRSPHFLYHTRSNSNFISCRCRYNGHQTVTGHARWEGRLTLCMLVKSSVPSFSCSKMPCLSPLPKSADACLSNRVQSTSTMGCLLLADPKCTREAQFAFSVPGSPKNSRVSLHGCLFSPPFHVLLTPCCLCYQSLKCPGAHTTFICKAISKIQTGAVKNAVYFLALCKDQGKPVFGGLYDLLAQSTGIS